MQKSQIKNIINSFGGKFFTVEYIKKNGELRKANCKALVKSVLKGGDNPHQNSNCIVYFDNNAKGYRSFDASRLIKIKCGKFETRSICRVSHNK